MYQAAIVFLITSLLLIGGMRPAAAQFNDPQEEIRLLQIKLKKSRVDTVKIRVLLDMAEFASYISLDSSENYVYRALSIANKIKNDRYAVKSLSLLGDIYRLSNDQDRAIRYYLKAEERMQNIALSERDAFSFYFIAEVFREKDQVKKAEEYYLKALEIAESQDEFSSSTIRFVTLSGLINLYRIQERYNEAFEKYEKIAKLHKNLLDEDFIVLNKKEVGSMILSMYQDIADAKAKRLRAITNTLVVSGILILCLVVVFLYLLNRRRKKMNNLLFLKNQELDREKSKVDELLLNIFPKEIADELKTQGKSEIKAYRLVSVLFTDFKGFTQIAEQMAPKNLIYELNECFTHFDEIIRKHNLEKIKTIGDAYMCAGGIPVPNPSNPIDIVLAGLDIQRFMQKRQMEKMDAGEKYWQCRLGINTGEVIAGVIGKTKFAYDIWSDTVNTASRTETNGEVDKVNITQQTYKFIKDFFECEYRGKVKVKGKGDIEMYFVKQIKPELSLDGKGEEPNETFNELRQIQTQKILDPSPDNQLIE